MSRPADWKSYEDFASGIDTNRLPATTALVGETFDLALGASRLTLSFKSGEMARWEEGGAGDDDWYEALLVAPDTYFIDLTFKSRPRQALTLVVNVVTRRAMSVRCIAGARQISGKPLVEQQFDVGLLAGAAKPLGMQPRATRDLIGLRAFYRYSPRHLYEHVYLSSERYAWQCLVGEQRGHGDVDLADTYQFDEDQYVFTFREFIIPVASVFFYNFRDLRSTGKFLGLTQSGAVQNNKAGAFIQKASMTYYERGAEPV
jgi:MoaF C-terminal domain/MoaF N-terminal domain